MPRKRSKSQRKRILRIYDESPKWIGNWQQISTGSVTVSIKDKKILEFRNKNIKASKLIKNHICFPYRQLTSKGVINWDMLSAGSFSTTFRKELSSSSAGMLGVSFGLEVSGMMLKRSNLEFFFNSKNSERTSRRARLVQVF